MKRPLFLLCAIYCIALWACSGNQAQELLDTAQLEEQQHNLPHARQLYDDVIRLYPSSAQAETARARLAQLNVGQ
ncbi:MAG: hypothetical protein U0412_03270 [Nitrospira sp.]